MGLWNRSDRRVGERGALSSRLVPPSRTEQRLDRPAFIHGAVALRNLVERQGQVEDLPRIDLLVPDELDEIGQVAAHRGRAPVEVDVGVKELPAVELHLVRDSDEGDVAALPGRADRLHHRLLGPDALEYRVGANAP